MAIYFSGNKLLSQKIRVLDLNSKKSIESAQVFLNSDLIAETDKFGCFYIDSAIGDIEIKKEGYLSSKAKINSRKDITVFMHLSNADKAIPLLHEKKNAKFITSSVSFIDGSSFENTPSTETLNTLSGRVSGLGIIQLSGLPGNEESIMKIRGQHTFGNHPGSIVLVDGHRTDIRMLDPYDIESITILKDAAATVLYGLNSTNGVVLITTKRGEEGKLNINFNASLTIQQPDRLPKFLNSYQYAVLYNEAVLNDNPNAMPLYSIHDIQGYESGKSPYAYPNVDWNSLFINNNTFQNRYNFNLSGSSGISRYYVSLGYVNNSGIFNVENQINTYNTNTSLSVFNVHGNIELKVNKNFTVNADIKAKKDTRNTPGSYASNFDEKLLTSLYSTPNNAFQPITYNNLLGGWYNGSNPYGLLNYSGYSIFENNFISTTVDFKYDLTQLVKGMSLFGFFGINSSNDYVTYRTKNFASYILNPSATIWYKRGDDSPISSSGGYQSISRNYNHLVGINYKKDIDKHRIDLSLMAQRQQLKQHLYSSIGQIFQGFKTKLSYHFNEKYIFDLAASYEGSNYYPPENRYGLFSALSFGWIISNESFLKNNENVNLLKLRGSLGRTGNGIGTAWATYYGYLSNFSVGSGAYFGTSLVQSTGMYQSRVANDRLTWEKADKANIGVDFAFLKNRLTGTVDVFSEENKDILIANAVSVMYGADIWVPEGRMRNSGYELDLGWQDNIKKFNYFVKLNYSFTRNIIDYKNEEVRQFPWMEETGNPYGTRFGYVFDRFFTEDDDFEKLPNQSLLGDVQPGDLKYKDLNNDGIIDENDRTVIGKAKFPEVFYGLNLGFALSGLDFSMLFQGTGNSSTYNSGYAYWAFHNKTGNITASALNRWTPGSGQNAEYPRLSLTNTNNTQTNSFWIADNSFLRLENIELGYTLPVSFSKKLSATKIRLFLMGTNLYSWDNIQFKDPEGEDEALRYPNVKSFTCGLNISF